MVQGPPAGGESAVRPVEPVRIPAGEVQGLPGPKEGHLSRRFLSTESKPSSSMSGTRSSPSISPGCRRSSRFSASRWTRFGWNERRPRPARGSPNDSSEKRRMTANSSLPPTSKKSWRSSFSWAGRSRRDPRCWPRSSYRSFEPLGRPSASGLGCFPAFPRRYRGWWTLDSGSSLSAIPMVPSNRAFGIAACAEKPDRRIFEHALSVSGAEPETTLHVGDLYDADVLGARAAGIHPALIDPFDDWRDVDCQRFRDVAELQIALCAARAADFGRLA